MKKLLFNSLLVGIIFFSVSCSSEEEKTLASIDVKESKSVNITNFGCYHNEGVLLLSQSPYRDIEGISFEEALNKMYELMNAKYPEVFDNPDFSQAADLYNYSNAMDFNFVEHWNRNKTELQNRMQVSDNIINFVDQVNEVNAITYEEIMEISNVYREASNGNINDVRFFERFDAVLAASNQLWVINNDSSILRRPPTNAESAIFVDAVTCAITWYTGPISALATGLASYIANGGAYTVPGNGINRIKINQYYESRFCNFE